MLSAPATVQQNPSADPGCQWSQQLIVQENLGFAVQLTRLLAGGADWTPRMQQLFGSTRLAALGMLQARVCWPGPTAPPQTLFEVDGIDETGVPVTATFQASYTGATANASALAATQTSMTLTADVGPTAASGNLTLNYAGSGALNVSVLPANRSTSWLTANAQTSTSSHQVALGASSAGLAPGVYSATLLIQAVDAVPQFVEVPIVFLVGTSSGTAIDHIANGASFQPAFAPGMVLSVFGSQLAPSTQVVSAPPLPTMLAGVSATVNGIPAPFYYVSSNQLKIQIPYEAGSGPAVMGMNNNGHVASFLFAIATAAPGIFSDDSQSRALVPFSSGKRGDTLMLFMTGEGQVSPALANGATPFGFTPIGLLPQPMLPVGVTVGGVPAQTLFAGVPSGLTGASQINFTIPANAPTGVQPVVVTVAGVSSPAASLTVNP
jgi:uncharacterized protein (TIGR03437 family)